MYRGGVLASILALTNAIHTLSTTQADVVLLDFDLGEEQESSLLVDRRDRRAELKVLMVTAGMADDANLRVMEADASGIFVQHSYPDQLVAEMRRVASNEIWLDSRAVRSLIAARKDQTQRSRHFRSLTPRQIKLLHGIL
jgi:DNA-binding NarL/FixJ family response regulator